ncbi:MAG: RNase adapter RapZ [Lachnospiraceae bacterium]|jgi:UPF0042 nucleotide-binding protein|nr:RNase adapter RapZ [Lachnospiraceae bacterium]MDD4524617.1 RNase adapter RapZ [Lachnospiraceae bacterium]
MQIVIVTGMSGGGKMTAIKMLEDQGYYCVDNLPVRLIDKFMELMSAPGSEITKACIGIDVRSEQSFDYVLDVLRTLKEKGYEYQILYMDASDEVLIKRYKESRRAHPLSPDGRVEDGIEKERRILKDIKTKANYVIDTSNLLTRDLKEELVKIFQGNKKYNSLMVSIISFGFKYGIPTDADLVFDVRFLPNPYYIEAMKHLTGEDKTVHDYVMSFPQTQEFMKKLVDMLQYLIPYYVKEGKNQLVIAVGCTGGQHRSVTIANEIYAALKDHGDYGINLVHRDLSKHN